MKRRNAGWLFVSWADLLVRKNHRDLFHPIFRDTLTEVRENSAHRKKQPVSMGGRMWKTKFIERITAVLWVLTRLGMRESESLSSYDMLSMSSFERLCFDIVDIHFLNQIKSLLRVKTWKADGGAQDPTAPRRQEKGFTDLLSSRILFLSRCWCCCGSLSLRGITSSIHSGVVSRCVNSLLYLPTVTVLSRSILGDNHMWLEDEGIYKGYLNCSWNQLVDAALISETSSKSEEN